jgi:hypothetical protein
MFNGRSEKLRTNEGLADGRRQCRHKQENGHDERTHILGCLRESIFETSDGCEDLADSDEDVAGRPFT